MDVPQSFYAILVGAVLVVMAATWAVVRLRKRGDDSRIEPSTEIRASGDDASPKAEALTAPAAILPPVPDGLTGVMPESPSAEASGSPERAIEQGYKGFKIRLSEKQPGLWVASIADGEPRARKKPAEERKASLTHEYYQFPAALAEAKLLIDRRLARR